MLIEHVASKLQQFQFSLVQKDESVNVLELNDCKAGPKFTHLTHFLVLQSILQHPNKEVNMQDTAMHRPHE